MHRFTAYIKVAIWMFPLTIAAVSYARSQVDPKSEMIRSADVIAILEIGKVESVQTHAALALYRERAPAKVEGIVKGVLPEKDLHLFGNEQQLVEARTRLSSGRFLVFLKQDTVSEALPVRKNEKSASVWQAIYAGANGEPSLRPIYDRTVEWYADDRYAMKILAPLQSVLDEIQKTLAASATPVRNGGSNAAKR